MRLQTVVFGGQLIVGLLTLPAAAGTFSVVSFSSDADSGISATNVYTHRVDCDVSMPTPPTVINGVAFPNWDRTGANYNVSGMAGGSNGTYMTATSGVPRLMRDWFYEDDERGTGVPMVVTLTGLTAGVEYDARFYGTGEVIFGAAPITVKATNGSIVETLNGYDENPLGWHYVSYRYVAAGSQLSVSFAPQIFNMDREFQLYGFTNEVVPEPAGLAIIAVGAVTALARRNRVPM